MPLLLKVGKVVYNYTNIIIDFLGVDYFVHFKSIIMDEYRNLSEGEKVIFSPNETARGFAAIEADVV